MERRNWQSCSSLTEGVLKGISPESEEAKRIVILHKEWLLKTWERYTAQAHKNLVIMYTADERFRKYYDKETDGCTDLLKKSVHCWADRI